MKRAKPKRALPRGPHGLSRDEVVESQRQRLFMSMIECVAANGYARTSVADVLAKSGVSRATFYTHFQDKEDCFRAAYQRAAEQIASVLGSDLQTMLAAEKKAEMKQDPLQNLDKVLGVYLDMLASQPAFTSTFLVEVYAAGPRAVAQRQASLDAFVDVVAMTLHGVPGPFGSDPDQRFAVRFLVHGVSSMVTSFVGGGQIERLPALREPLMTLVREFTGLK